jgi:hypothetical protein
MPAIAHPFPSGYPDRVRVIVVIALARTHDVDAIVSGDKDLLEWEEQRRRSCHPPSSRIVAAPHDSVIRSIGANHTLQALT